jgi:hypothetical protein
MIKIRRILSKSYCEDLFDKEGFEEFTSAVTRYGVLSLFF